MKGFVKLPRRVLFDSGLSEGAKLLYAALVSYAGRDGFCYPGQQRLANDLAVGERAIRRRVRELADAGLVRVEKPRAGRTNRYRLCPLEPTAASGDRSGGPPEPPAAGHRRPPPYKKVDSEEVEADALPSLRALAEAFLRRVGYPRPSHAKRERAISILRTLHDEGYGLADIEAACELAATRKARGAELIPHLIGEAAPRPALCPGAQAVEEAEAQERDLWQERKARFEALPPDQQAALIRQAQDTSPLLAARPTEHPLVRAKAMEMMDAKGDDHV